MSRMTQFALAAAVAASCLGGASAQTFQGRLADGTHSATCTVSGANKCTMFFNPTLNITILNNWNLGQGNWSATADSGSAQALAASAGLAASGLAGWVLPTGNGNLAAGAQNQYLSIWNEVGSSFAGLNGQFDGVQSDFYWSGTEDLPNPFRVWYLYTSSGNQDSTFLYYGWYAVAVRPGDVAPIPEPQTYAMLLAGLGALMVAVRRRPR